MAVNLDILGPKPLLFHSSSSSQLSSWGWVDPVPDPLFLRKSGSAGNRTWDLWICNQELWPLDHSGGLLKNITPRILLRSPGEGVLRAMITSSLISWDIMPPSCPFKISTSSCWLLDWFILRPWRWSWHVPPKPRNAPHYISDDRTQNFLVTSSIIRTPQQISEWSNQERLNLQGGQRGWEDNNKMDL
jgi:hypothetical protein